MKLLAAFAVLIGACSKDVVLPSNQIESVCGDGIVEPGEECDVSSPGCVNCLVVPDYTCTRTGCNVLCGDGVVGDGPRCDNPRKVEPCDMTGFWMARETNFTRDRIVNDVQVASTWYLYSFSQIGDAFQVEQELHCGVHGSGSAMVDSTPGLLKGAIYQNDQEPQGSHGPRRGTFTPDGNGGCVFTFDRWYSGRGIVESLLPVDFLSHVDLKDLPPLPSESDPEQPTGTNLMGATDPDGDGIPGAAFRISGGLAVGIRNSAERDFKEYATPPGQPVPANAIEFVVPGDWDEQENVLAVTECGNVCPLLTTPADVAHDLDNRITFRFIGHELDSARVSAVVVANPRDDVDHDLVSCANVRFALPHDASSD